MTKIQEILNEEIEEYMKENKVIGYKQKVVQAIRRWQKSLFMQRSAWSFRNGWGNCGKT